MSADNRKTSKRTTLTEVARLARVSPGTVSNAINGNRFVEPETRKRIENAIAELRYVPNLRARQLRTGNTNTIALFSSMPLAVSSGASRLGFMMEIALTAATIALQRSHTLILVPPTTENLAPLFCDAAIVIEPAAGDAVVMQLLQNDTAVVSIGRMPDAPPELGWVDLRSYETARLLLDHLTQCGATKIALLIGEKPRAAYLDTEECYRQFAAEKYAPIVFTLDEEAGEQAGYQAAFQLRQQHPDVDGILVLVDTFATGVVKAMQEMAVAIPEQIRIATRYDGIRAREARPVLTAVNLHLDEIAKQAMEMLFSQMAGHKSTDAPGVKPELVERDSSVIKLHG